MANTIAIDPTHRTSPKHGVVGLVLLSVVTDETYTTASGGFTLDLVAPLATLGIQFADVLLLEGLPTLTGHTPVAVKTATASQFTIRLWNGATEIANGALTQTLRLKVLYNPGAQP